MDWIEQWWGLNPDGGNGTVEAALVTIALLAAGLGVAMRSGALRASVVAATRALRRTRSTRPSR